MKKRQASGFSQDKQFKELIKVAEYARKRPQTAFLETIPQTGPVRFNDSQRGDPNLQNQIPVGRKGIFFTHSQTEQIQARQLKTIYKRLEGMQMSVNSFKRAMSHTKVRIDKNSRKGRFESRGTADEQAVTYLPSYN